MRILHLLVLAISFSQVGCNGFSAAPSARTIAAVTSPSSTPVAPSLSDSNVMALQVGCGYANEPCVTVTVCVPGTSNCKSIPNVLVDTGSYGLRIFSSVLSGLSLPSVSTGSGTMAECVSYLDNSSDWGPIATADIMLGSQRASNVRMQIIQSTYPGIPSGCTNPDDSPANIGFNGIIGLGMYTSDCGPGCETTAANETYYSCSGTTCTNIAVPEASQVSNPIASLATDNNGVALQLPDVSSSGSDMISGYLIFGVATRGNNTPIGATVLTTDQYGEISTTFNGHTYSAFLDSGSNGLYFPQPSSLTTCGSNTDVAGWYCPSTAINFSATLIGNNNISANVGFQIGNAQTLLDSNFIVFNNVGAPNSSGFDWGLPFYLGRTVYVGLDSKSSSLASGTYWAF